MLPETLVLLRPEYLLRIPKVSDKDQLCTVLNLLQQALDDSPQSALITINQALEILGPVEVIETGETLTTNTSLKTWEVDDYDQFFALNHVHARDPARCLLASILIACRALLELICCTSVESGKMDIEAQKIGFKSCVSLFCKTFDIGLE